MLSEQVENGRVRNDHQQLYQPISIQILCDKHTALGRRNASQFVFLALAELDMSRRKIPLPFPSGDMSEVLANNRCGIVWRICCHSSGGPGTRLISGESLLRY